MLRLVSVVLAATVVTAVISCGGGDGTPSPTRQTTTPFSTVFPPRPEEQLTMCVDTVDATKAFQSEAVERIRTAMVQVMEHPMYLRAYTSGQQPVIDGGCPAPPALYDSAALDVSPPRTLGDVRGRIAERPSYYSEAVFVIEDQELERYVADYDWRFTGEEFVWLEGDVYSRTTDGLYLSPADFGRTTFLVDLLEKHIGLEKDTDPIEPGYHPASEPDP